MACIIRVYFKNQLCHRQILSVYNQPSFYASKRNYVGRNITRLEERGLLSAVFPHEAKQSLDALCNGRAQTVYAGFDPTADSLHLGNLAVMMFMIHCQRAGHRVIALIGGATGMIGDPSGKSTERVMLDREVVLKNCKSISQNIENVFSNHQKHYWDDKNGTEKLPALKIVNNLSWYENMSSIEFIGHYGRYLRMAQMLSRDSVKTRLQSGEGLSFTEFSYQLFQAFDWFHLFKKYDCKIQIGGHDQMGNIVSGHEFIGRALNKAVYGVTVPLIKSESGNKYGKTAGNAIWLDSTKTSPLDFYQFALRATDAEVEQLLKIFTFRKLDEIDSIMQKHKDKPDLRRAQKVLAEDLTRLIHGETDAFSAESGLQSAIRASEAIYANNVESLAKLTQSEMLEIFTAQSNTVGVADLVLSPGTTILDMACKANCFKSDRDARRIIAAGGFYLNHQRVQNEDEVIVPGIHILANNLSLARVGKKNYYLIRWNS